MYNYVVPGPVSGLTARPTEFSIVLTWSAPQEPNGVIINYEVTYSVNGSTLVTANTTDLSTAFTIPRLTIGIVVSSVSVSAYTGIGRGEATRLEDITIAPLCKDFRIINAITITAIIMNTYTDTVDFGIVAGAVVAILVVTAMVVFLTLLAVKMEW